MARKPPFFSKDKWFTFFHDMLKTPILHQYETGYGFEKRHYHLQEFRLILFRHDNGTQRLLLFDEHGLQVEGTFEDNRFYVTSDTMLRVPFVVLQEPLVTFMETFAGNEQDGTNDRLILDGLKTSIQELQHYQTHPSIEQEAEELWFYFQSNKNAIPYAPQMRHALEYLHKRAHLEKQEGVDTYEHARIYDEGRL